MPARKYQPTFRAVEPLDSRTRNLVVQNIGVAYHFAPKSEKKYSIEFDDALQIAFLGLIKAARYFDSSKARFSTLAYLSMSRLASNWARSKLTLIRTPFGEKALPLSSLDVPVSSDYSLTDSETFLDRVPSHYVEDTRYLDLYLAIDKLPSTQREVILGVLRGERNDEIGQRLGLHRNSVSRVKHKALRKLRRLLAA